MFRRLLTLIVATGLVLEMPALATGQTQAAAPGAETPVVSPDHVSDGLRRPELFIPPVDIQEPTFRSGVTEKLETPLDAIRRELQEEARLRPWERSDYHYQPGVIAQVDVMPALYSLVAKIKSIRREHAEAEARQMVQEELDAFCAQHDCTEAAEQLPLEGVILPH